MDHKEHDHHRDGAGLTINADPVRSVANAHQSRAATTTEWSTISRMATSDQNEHVQPGVANAEMRIQTRWAEHAVAMETPELKVAMVLAWEYFGHQSFGSPKLIAGAEKGLLD